MIYIYIYAYLCAHPQHSQASFAIEYPYAQYIPNKTPTKSYKVFPSTHQETLDALQSNVERSLTTISIAHRRATERPWGWLDWIPSGKHYVQ